MRDKLPQTKKKYGTCTRNIIFFLLNYISLCEIYDSQSLSHHVRPHKEVANVIKRDVLRRQRAIYTQQIVSQMQSNKWA